MKRKKVIALITAALTFTMTVCGSLTAAAASELTAESKPATQYTIDANQEVYALLDFEDTAEFENATKGQIASPDTLDIYDENGKLVWSQTAYAVSGSGCSRYSESKSLERYTAESYLWSF